MKGQNKFFALQSFILAVTIIFGAAAVSAKKLDVASSKGISEQAMSSIVTKLSKKLQIDLADNSVTVKISDIEKHQSTKNEIDFKGTAYCVVKSENNQLPLTFEAKINPRTQSVADVNYNFVEETSDFAPTTTEEILMQELMKKLSKDYKTDSVVISIDGFDTFSSAGGKQYSGVGEVKIGEVEWSKINFDVVLDENNKPAKIKYDIK
ncbi:MAG TPA: hypothetical protein VGC76_08585 [Pyrinomonadaceae bacterium]|jgi:hypothetical protein